jgi:hypothetical protein
MKVESGSLRRSKTTTENPDGTRKTTEDYSFTWDPEDLLAAAGCIVVVGFAFAMIFKLTPVENWKLLLTFVSALGAAVAAIVSARKKTARQTKPTTKTQST